MELPADPTRYARQHRLALAMVCTTLVLIAFGAMVTSTGSGMAFADWPRADGEWMPERALSTLDGFLEHFHRIIAAIVGLMMLILLVWAGRAAADQPWLRRLLIGGLALVVTQGLFGGIGVLLELPVFTSATHGVLAQVTLATFTVILFPCRPAAPSRRSSTRTSCARPASGSGSVSSRSSCRRPSAPSRATPWCPTTTRCGATWSTRSPCSCC